MTTLTHPSKLFGARHQRAASLRQVWGQQLGRFGRSLWAALEDAGQRRAAPYLLHEATRHELSDPTLAAELRRLARPRSFTAPAATPASAR